MCVYLMIRVPADHGPSPCPYSPECVEGLFSELVSQQQRLVESAIPCSVCSHGGLACYGLILRFAPALWQCHLHRIHGRG
jgi:hypothetical protein